MSAQSTSWSNSNSKQAEAPPAPPEPLAPPLASGVLGPPVALGSVAPAPPAPPSRRLDRPARSSSGRPPRGSERRRCRRPSSSRPIQVRPRDAGSSPSAAPGVCPYQSSSYASRSLRGVGAKQSSEPQSVRGHRLKNTRIIHRARRWRRQPHVGGPLRRNPTHLIGLYQNRHIARMVEDAVQPALTRDAQQPSGSQACRADSSWPRPCGC